MGVIPAVIGGLGAVSGFLGAKEQAKATEKANAPKPFHSDTTSSTNPWAPAAPYLEGALGEAQDLYNDPKYREGPPDLINMPEFGQFFGGGGGGGGGGFSGTSGRTGNILGEITDRAMDSSYIDSAKDMSLGMADIGGGSNPLLDKAFSAAQGIGGTGTNANLQSFIDMGMGDGFDPGQDMYRQVFEMLAGDVGGPSSPAPTYTGGGMSIRGHGGGGGGGGPESGQYVDPLWQAEYEKVVGGDYLDEQNPHMQAVIDNLRRENEDVLAQSLMGLDGAAERAGRYGGGMYQQMGAMTRAENAQDLTGEISGMLAGNYEQERQRMMEMLGLKNQRDASRWGDMTSRAGIDAQRSSAAASAGAAATRAAQEAELRKIGMMLDAAGGVSQGGLGSAQILGQAVGQGAGFENQLQGLGLQTMASLGLGAGDQALGALGLAPGLEQSGYYGLQTALAGSQQSDAARSAQEASRRAAQMQQQQMAYDDAWRQWGAQQDRADQQWDWGANRDLDMFGDYLGAISGIGAMGGSSTSHTEGVAAPNTQAIAPSPIAAGIQGGLGGALAAWGASGGRQAKPGWSGQNDAWSWGQV